MTEPTAARRRARVALVAHWDWVLHNFRLSLAGRLRDRGLEVTFVCPPGEYVARLEQAGFRWLPWRVDRRGLNPLRDGASIARLAALYRHERFAAVHHFTIKPILYGSIAARLARVPATLNAFTGLGFLFSERPAAVRLRPLVLPVLRRLLHGPSVHTVFQNASDRARFVDARLVPADRVTIIGGSGVDTERFAPAPDVERPAQAVVLMAARLLWDKGVGEFVEAAGKLRAARTRATFRVAGTPDRGNPACIPDDVLERWRQEGTVEFLGHRDDMPAVVRQASIAALPTAYQEGVPRFLLEAAATGLPVVASDVEGCRVVVREGVNGFLVPPRDPAALAEALARLIEDRPLRERMGRAGREIAVATFDEHAILDQQERLYRALGVLR